MSAYLLVRNASLGNAPSCPECRTHIAMAVVLRMLSAPTEWVVGASYSINECIVRL